MSAKEGSLDSRADCRGTFTFGNSNRHETAKQQMQESISQTRPLIDLGEPL